MISFYDVSAPVSEVAGHDLTSFASGVQTWSDKLEQNSSNTLKF